MRCGSTADGTSTPTLGGTMHHWNPWGATFSSSWWWNSRGCSQGIGTLITPLCLQPSTYPNFRMYGYPRTSMHGLHAGLASGARSASLHWRIILSRLDRRTDGGGWNGQGGSAVAHEERAAWAYNCTLLYGWLQQASKWEMIWQGGRVLGTDNSCTKIGRPFQEILQWKHTLLQKIDSADPVNSKFELYKEVPEVVPLDITISYVEVMAWRIGGVGVPGRVYIKVLKYWCIWLSVASEHLQVELAWY